MDYKITGCGNSTDPVCPQCNGPTKEEGEPCEECAADWDEDEE